MADDPTPSRRSRDELRELVLDAAVELLRRDGLSVRPTSITYKQVFDHLEQSRGVKVTRGSVHERIWKNQEEFQAEAIERAALWRTVSTEAVTRATVDALLEADHDSRWANLAHVVRTTAPVAQSVSEESGLYQAWIGLTLAVACRSENDQIYATVSDSVAQSYEEATLDLADMYRQLAVIGGWRLSSGQFRDAETGWNTLAKLGMALSEGCTLRTRFDPDELAEVEIIAGEGLEREPWHPFAIGMLALLRFFLEPDPDR